jgi:hypothetical protein
VFKVEVKFISLNVIPLVKSTAIKLEASPGKKVLLVLDTYTLKDAILLEILSVLLTVEPRGMITYAVDDT